MSYSRVHTPIVDIHGEGYVILVEGKLRTVGKGPGYNLYPLRVHLKQGQPIEEVTNQVDLSGRYLGELQNQLDLSKAHYLYGELELEEAIDPPYYTDRWNPISGSSRIELSLARWEDLAPYQDIRVRSGVVIIRQRLRPGEAFNGNGGEAELPSSSHPTPISPPASPGSSMKSFQPKPKPIPLEFEVASTQDLLVQVGQHLEVGDLLVGGPQSGLNASDLPWSGPGLGYLRASSPRPN